VTDIQRSYVRVIVSWVAVMAGLWFFQWTFQG
jgi:hypothetical protein